MSNMKPAGYLNKFTGMIWNPEQQPGADSEPEIYEPLVRLSDVHGLVAETAALKDVVGLTVNNLYASGYEAKQNSMHPWESLIFEGVKAMSTPATDAVIAEIGAKPLDNLAGVAETMLVKFCNAGVSHCPEAVGWRLVKRQAESEAANLRAGRKG